MPRTGRSPTNCAARSHASSRDGERPRLRAGAPDASTTPPTAGSRGCSPPNMPASSTCSCPASPRWRLPLPLGGSSNHFRTATLRRSAAGIAYNVTEDADLGMRLARFGYRAIVIDSTTYEEAPARLRPLAAPAHALVQRLDADLAGAHARAAPADARTRPVRALSRSNSWSAATCSPRWSTRCFWRADLWRPCGAPMWRGRQRERDRSPALYAATLMAGYLASAFLAWSGLARRGLLQQRLGAGCDAAALAAAVARGLARAGPARHRALSLGEDRARAGEKFAAGRST